MVAATTNTITHPCANQRVDDDSKITLTSSDISAGRPLRYSLHTSLTFLGEDEDRAIQDTVATGSVEESGSDFSAGKCSDKLRSNLSVARQDIALSSPHASSLQTSDSDHAHPLVSLKHSKPNINWTERANAELPTKISNGTAPRKIGFTAAICPPT